MNDEQLRDAYERGLPASDGTPALDDMSADRLRRLVEQEGSESERLRTLDLALSTAEGRRELEIAWAAARAARPARSRATSWRTYAVAASLLVVAGASTIVWRERASVDDSVTRAAESPITLVTPAANVSRAAANRFVWHALPRVDRYTLVIVDTTGAEVFASETRDTAVTLPDTVRLTPGRAYLWWVQARLADQTTVTAVTQRVTITK
jgi:hypothetical protein